MIDAMFTSLLQRYNVRHVEHTPAGCLLETAFCPESITVEPAGAARVRELGTCHEPSRRMPPSESPGIVCLNS